ncbi:MAG: hypothetical protein WCF36_16135 [Candidatus Nanopelagicales bacterium]
MTILVETDARSRIVLPGHPNKRFVLQEQEDGSILLQPALVTTRAQAEYDNDPELQALLGRATRSSTVQRSRTRRAE